MDATSTGTLVTGGLSQFGDQGLTILGAVIVIAVGLIIFYWGMRKIRGVAR